MNIFKRFWRWITGWKPVEFTDGQIAYFEFYYEKTGTALDYLVTLKRNNISPRSKRDPKQLASNSELRTWLDQGAVEINGKYPGSKDILEFPITSLVFFKNNKITII